MAASNAKGALLELSESLREKADDILKLVDGSLAFEAAIICRHVWAMQRSRDVVDQRAPM